MPTRPPRICGSCGKTHLSGEQCLIIAERVRARKAKHDAKRPSRQARGYDAEWNKARAEWLASYPSCRRCGAKATLVDHIETIKQAPHRRLDRTNFQSLCTSCHSSWKQAQDKRKDP